VIYALIMSDIKENELGELQVRRTKEELRAQIMQILVEDATREIQEEEDRRIFEDLEHTICG
jgi:hypothetical protein